MYWLFPVDNKTSETRGGDHTVIHNLSFPELSPNSHETRLAIFPVHLCISMTPNLHFIGLNGLYKLLDSVPVYCCIFKNDKKVLMTSRHPRHGYQKNSTLLEWFHNADYI